MAVDVHTETLELKRDGLTLRGFLSLPKSDSFDVAVLFHGFMMNCGRDPDSLILQLAGALNERGIATVRVDFAGQGNSDGTPEEMSVLSELLDASRILRYAETIPGARRLYVHGQSQGGVVASMIAGIYPERIAKLALTSAAATMVDDARKGVLMGQTYNPDAVPDLQYVQGNPVGGFYLRTNQKLPVYEWAGNYKGTVLILHAEEDTTVDRRAALRYHDTFQNSELHILPGGNHALSGGIRKTVLQMVGDFFASEDIQH